MSDPTEDGPRVKRFKHQSYNQTLKDVHLPSVLGEPKFDYSIDDNDSHFHNALEHWKQLNLSPDFIRFAHVAAPLSASMPLLLHNAVAVTNHWLEAAATADDEGLRALLDLLQHLAHDLRTSLSPAYPGLLARILGFLPRALPAPTLTALLAALSALFSALLVPTRTPPARIPATWTRLRAALPTARPETQRAVAEVWGAVLRRLKGTLRAEAATLVAADSKGIEDASAWIFVYACKSVSQTLHTSASPIISALLNHYLECENSSSALLLHRVLTALAHHVQTADQYAPLADVLVSSLTTAVVGNNPDLVRRALDAVTIPCAVRQGSRLSSTHLTTLTTALCTPAALAAPDQSFLRCAAAALCAGAPHTALLDAVWMSPIRGLRLAGALAEMRWIAWRVDMLPRVLRASPAILLDADAEVAAGAAAALVRLQGQRKLGDTDAVWRTRVGTWAAKALAEWGRPGDSAARLNDVLALAVHASNIAPALAALVDSALNAEVADARTAGACMLELARRGPMEWSAANVDVGGWVPRALARCPGEEVLLGGIVALVQASDAADIPALTLENLYPSLQDALISHRRDLRLNALRLLAAPGITMPVGARDAVRRCLQGEEVPLDVAGVRARVLRIGRAAPGVRNGDKVGADICARWLIAQLKANLRPLWSPAAAALAGLAERFGEEVWTLVFSELKDVSKGISSEERGEEDERKNLEEQGDVEESEEREEERTWRDPSAYKLRTALANWLRQDLRPVDPVTPESNDRLDHRSYHLQLLATLSECAALAEKHNRELIPLFLDLADPTTGPRLPRTQLAAWLALLARFTNPKAIMRTDSLRALYTDLLAHADRALQRAALACVLTYKDPGLAPHADRLHALLDDTRWRDELTALDIPALPPRGRSEVVGVLIRLLFGMMLEKRGRARGADRRAAVLGALAACENSELGLLVNLMLRPLGGCDTGRMATGFTVQALPEGVSEKQQIGFLTLLGDVLKNLGTRLVEHWPVLLGATIDTLAQAQARIDAIGADEEREGEEEEIEDDEDDEPKSTTSSKMTRSIRQLGLKRFANFFRLPVTFDFAPFMPTCFATFISPRLANLDRENTQAPSALLELFHVWALHGTHVRHLVAHDKRVIPMMYACLVAGSVKPAVIAHIFDTIERLLALSADDAWVAEHIVKPHVSLLLANLALLVERTKDVAAVSSPLGQRQIWILSEIAQYSTDGTQASTLLELFSPLLRRPAKMVPEKVKIDILKIIGNLLPLIADLADHTSTIYARTYKLLSQLFQTLRSRNARLSLVSAFHQFALIDSSLQPLADLLESLNAYSAKRIEEPDFDRRLEAFAKLNEVQFRTLSSQDWLPVVYNMLHSIQDQTELAVRNNASFALKNFIELAAIDSSPEIKALFVHTLYPGLKNGLHSKNEMVRAEILGVIAHAVAKCENIEPLQEMRVLLEGGDEEADFFNNIHHVQIHRRSRALRRLADHCDKGHLRSNTLAEIFVPLVGNYVVSSPSADHHLVNEAISTTGRIAKHLTWGAYNTLVQKYLRLSRDKDLSERIYVRTLVALLDSFHFPMEEVVPQATATLDVEDPTQLDETDEDETVAVPEQSLASTKNVGKIADAVNLRLLPTLLQHLEKHDKTTEDSTRIPIAIGIVKVAMHLPTATREPQITRLVTILSQILRSRSQETRDLTRDTLIRIAITLGPSYLPLMLREMRAALLRGPQLHVLAYVTHSMLVHVTAGQHSEVFHTLDDCVADISHVSAEVIFGESGKDVQADEFKTKMREVRVSSANGLDSFGIAARYVTPSKISSLLAPLRAIMQETESLKVMQVVDEVLKRITTGLNANKHLIPTELLVLCHTLITQNARFLQQAPLRKQKRNVGDAIVQTKRKLNTETDHYAVNSFRFVAFGLDLFETALRRNKFDFRDGPILARLESMVPVIGNTLYSSSTPVLILGLKAASGLVRCPLKSLGKSAPVFVRQVIDIIQATGSTESEVVQTCFKSLAGIIRDGQSVQVKEKDLAYLLELLSPDLEEPLRQASVFAMLRAIISRKFIVPEIYDLMDKVSEILVTSQSPQVQEQCRGVFLQFLLDYPQGKGRLRNQMTFLAKNLTYVHDNGRQSVMELLSAVLSKFEISLVREYGDLFFIALVMVIVNDESAKCREMASELIKSLISRLDDSHRRIMVSHLHSWASQHSKPQLARVSSQVSGLLIDVLQADSLPYISEILEDTSSALKRSAQEWDSAKEENDMDTDIEWQIPYHALIVAEKIARTYPDLITQPNKIPWAPVVAHLLFPHAWVRTASCRLLGQLFAAVAPGPPPLSSPSPDSPLTRERMLEIARNLCIQLKSEHLDDVLSTQIVKNLLFVGKSFYAIPIMPSDEVEEEDSGEDADASRTDEMKKQNPLPWLFSTLSYQVRSAHIARRNRTFSAPNWTQQPSSILKWFAAMASQMDPPRLEEFLVHILTPVYRLVEDDTIRDSQMSELKTLATELQDLVQRRVGTTAFSSTYSKIRQGALTIRRERKVAKLTQATTNPEAAAKRKLQRNVLKKDSRKRKDRAFGDRKGRTKRRRED